MNHAQRLIYSNQKCDRFVNGPTRLTLRSARIAGIKDRIYGIHYQLKGKIFWNTQVCYMIDPVDSINEIEEAKVYMQDLYQAYYL